MTTERPTVLLVFDQRVRDKYIARADLDRLQTFADWDWLPVEGGVAFGPNDDPAAIARLGERIGAVDGLVICHGAPRISAELLAQAPRLRIVGELEGDRFADRFDLEAAWVRDVRTVDTTNGSSYPVAEWALALIMIALRNAGEQFRRMIEPVAYVRSTSDFGYLHGELYGKTVGLIGCGHIGRRLITFLRPFNCSIRVYDPYLAPELSHTLDAVSTSLDLVMAEPDAVVCLAPQS